jgi:hypothetical protein
MEVLIMEKNRIQEVVEQIGLPGTVKYLPKGMKLHDCPMHGSFLSHYTTDNPLCPLCQVHAALRDENNNEGNGDNAKSIEHYIRVVGV